MEAEEYELSAVGVDLFKLLAKTLRLLLVAVNAVSVEDAVRLACNVDYLSALCKGGAKVSTVFFL